MRELVDGELTDAGEAAAEGLRRIRGFRKGADNGRAVGDGLQLDLRQDRVRELLVAGLLRAGGGVGATGAGEDVRRLVHVRQQRSGARDVARADSVGAFDLHRVGGAIGGGYVELGGGARHAGREGYRLGGARNRCNRARHDVVRGHGLTAIGRPGNDVVVVACERRREGHGRDGIDRHIRAGRVVGRLGIRRR